MYADKFTLVSAVKGENKGRRIGNLTEKIP